MLSCPDDGVRPPNVVEPEELGGELGSVVVVAVGYNDYENIQREHRGQRSGSSAVGVEHVVWVTLREGRSSWARMNDIAQAAARHPEMSVVDWNARRLAPLVAAA